jgi:hypothetical protein
MIKNLGKKVHIWPRQRHNSINENEIAKDLELDQRKSPAPHSKIDNFRSRSKSLDVTISRKVLDDCEATYKIYNKILKEGNIVTLLKGVNMIILFQWIKLFLQCVKLDEYKYFSLTTFENYFR